MARPCLEDGSEGIPPRTTTVGLSGRFCDLLPLYTTMLGTGIIERVNRNHISIPSDRKISTGYPDFFGNMETKSQRDISL